MFSKGFDFAMQNFKTQYLSNDLGFTTQCGMDGLSKTFDKNQ